MKTASPTNSSAPATTALADAKNIEAKRWQNEGEKRRAGSVKAGP